MPRPEPTYAEKAQRAEGNLAICQQVAERLSKQVEELAPYKEQVADLQAQLSKMEFDLRLARQRAETSESTSNSWAHRAMQAEGRVRYLEQEVENIRLFVKDRECLLPEIQRRLNQIR
jgi:chromosome segregation ATPase